MHERSANWRRKSPWGWLLAGISMPWRRALPGSYSVQATGCRCPEADESGAISLMRRSFSGVESVECPAGGHRFNPQPPPFRPSNGPANARAQAKVPEPEARLLHDDQDPGGNGRSYRDLDCGPVVIVWIRNKSTRLLVGDGRHCRCLKYGGQLAWIQTWHCSVTMACF